MSTGRRLLLGLTGAAAGRVALAAVEELARQPSTARWLRPNHAGRPVTLLGGPAVAGVATLTAALGAPRGARAAALVAGALPALAGRYDDLAGDRPEQAADKGLAGHLRALRAGRVSAGVVKAAGIVAAGVAAAALTRQPAAGALLTTGLVAGTANAVNLLDLRPGRAGKVVAAGAAAGLPGAAGGLVAGPLGAVVAALPADLGERIMLGDCGANALGALLGLRLALLPSRRVRTGLLAGVTALTLAGERVSFTRVIEATAVLRELDRLGRRAA